MSQSQDGKPEIKVGPKYDRGTCEAVLQFAQASPLIRAMTEESPADQEDTRQNDDTN